VSSPWISRVCTTKRIPSKNILKKTNKQELQIFSITPSISKLLSPLDFFLSSTAIYKPKRTRSTMKNMSSPVGRGHISWKTGLVQNLNLFVNEAHSVTKTIGIKIEHGSTLGKVCNTTPD
jgi:hypothetical protein